MISVENRKFSSILYEETDFTVEFVLRNLVTPSNFIGFRDSRNFTFFEAPGVGVTHGMIMWMPYGTLGE